MEVTSKLTYRSITVNCGCAGHLNDVLFGILLAFTFVLAVLIRYVVNHCNDVFLLLAVNRSPCRKQDVLQYPDTSKSYLPRLADLSTLSSSWWSPYSSGFFCM